MRVHGAATSIALVATELGVTRPTVYRYFASAEAMLTAAAIDGNAGFLRRLGRRLRPITDPGEALVEAVAYTVGRAAVEPYLAMMMTDTPNALVRSVTSESSRAIGRVLLDQTSVDWVDRRLSDADIEDLIKWTLRTVQSFLVDPGDPPPQAGRPAQVPASLARPRCQRPRPGLTHTTAPRSPT